MTLKVNNATKTVKAVFPRESWLLCCLFRR